MIVPIQTFTDDAPLKGHAIQPSAAAHDQRADFVIPPTERTVVKDDIVRIEDDYNRI